MCRAWVCLLAASVVCAAAPTDATEIIRRSVANTLADWNTAPQYDFTERDVVTAKARTIKTYRVIMIEGSPYNELIAANGSPLDPARRAAQSRKLQQEIARRRRETPSGRRQRIAQYQRERRQDNELLEEMIKAIDFKVVGEDTVAGRRCFVLEGAPKAGYRPTSRDTRVLKGMRGKMWIDEQAYQWVKVEAWVFRPVAFGLFIAKVEPGTAFTLEQQPVRENLWLPSHFSVSVKARILRYWSHDTADDETYSNYTRASQAADRR